MQHTVYGVLQDQFEVDLGDDLEEAVSRASHDELRELQERMRSFAESARLPEKAASELRPYIPNERAQGVALPHGLRIRPNDFEDPASAGAAINALRHHLLYCNSIAIDDPLRWILDSYTAEPHPFMADYFERQKEKAQNCIRFLCDIAPLVLDGAIVLVETDIGLPDNAPLNRRIVEGLNENQTSGFDFSDLSAEASTWLESDREMRGYALALEGNEQLGASLATAEQYPGTVNLYMPYKYFVDLLRLAVSAGDFATPMPFGQVDMQLLRTLLDLEVPGLASLPSKDLILLRRDEEAFASWRASLRSGLQRVGEMGPEVIDREAEARVILDQEMEVARAALRTAIGRGGFVTQLQNGFKQFAISGVAALGLAPIADPVSGVAAAAANGLLALFAAYVDGKTGKELRMAAYSHYLVFSPTRPTEQSGAA